MVSLNGKLSSLVVVTGPREGCVELFRMQKSFAPKHQWGEVIAAPRLSNWATVFLLTTHIEKLALTKHCWICHCLNNCLIKVNVAANKGNRRSEI